MGTNQRHDCSRGTWSLLFLNTHTHSTHMCLLSNFKALHRLRLLHSPSQRAPWSGAVSLQNPASCDIGEGWSGFEKHSCATAGFFSIVAEHLFLFFPDVDDLLHNMSVIDGGAPGNTSTSSTPYVFLSLLIGISYGLFVPGIDLDMTFLLYIPNYMSSNFVRWIIMFNLFNMIYLVFFINL